MRPQTSRTSPVAGPPKVVPDDDALVEQLRLLRLSHPDYGVQRLKGAMKMRRPDWAVNERRVRKLLVQHSLNLPGKSQAEEDETKDFELTEEDLKADPLELFDLLEKRGKGTYGTVYKALHKPTGQIVAIKQVHVKDDINEIMREIRFMQSCKSKNIVRFYGHYLNNNILWIVMEYCAAGSVADLINLCNTVLNEMQISHICRDALRGLAYLHKMNAIHRDIKAGNIVVNSAGVAKLVDFGVSGQLTQTTLKRNTLTGTPYWIAPEVVTEDGYDCRADIWSLGITCIEMAEGKPPYHGMRPMLAMFRIPAKPPPRLTNEEGYSSEFVEFLAKCLTKKASDRPHAEELLQHPFVRERKQIAEAFAMDQIIHTALERIQQGHLDELQDTEATFEATMQANSSLNKESDPDEIYKSLAVKKKQSMLGSAANVSRGLSHLTATGSPDCDDTVRISRPISQNIRSNEDTAQASPLDATIRVAPRPSAVAPSASEEGEGDDQTGTIVPVKRPPLPNTTYYLDETLIPVDRARSADIPSTATAATDFADAKAAEAEHTTARVKARLSTEEDEESVLELATRVVEDSSADDTALDSYTASDKLREVAQLALAEDRHIQAIAEKLSDDVAGLCLSDSNS